MGLTLDLYLLRRFAVTILASFVAVFALVVLVDLVELIGDNARARIGIGALLGLAALHAPSLLLAAAPFTVLVAALFCFALLNRRAELIVIRASGVSLWRLLAPAVLMAAAVGVFALTVYHPIAATFTARYEVLREHYFGTGRSRLTVSREGVWLRQSGEAEQIIIHARRAIGSIGRLSVVSLFRFDRDGRLIERIEARAALLEPGAWRLTEARRWNFLGLDLSQASEAGLATRASGPGEIRIPTDLTVARIEESFSPPEAVTFLALPRFIELLEGAGFSAARHRLYYHGLLALPLVFVAMVLIGAAFALRPPRFGGLGRMALACVLTGFAYFVLSDVAEALGASATVSPMAAAWTPPLAALLLALGLLLHLEER